MSRDYFIITALYDYMCINIKGKENLIHEFGFIEG